MNTALSADPGLVAQYIPSPPVSSFSLGPLTIHFYALCILAGIWAAWWLSLIHI